MAILMGILGSALSVGSFCLLISSVNGACSGIVNLLACVGLVVCSVVGADGLYKYFKGKNH